MSPPPRGSIQRRRVDWPVLLGDHLQLHLVTKALPENLADVLTAFDELLPLDQPEAMLRQTVVIARHRIGVPRAAIFLLDRPRDLLLGTWGTDLAGHVVDEGHLF